MTGGTMERRIMQKITPSIRQQSATNDENPPAVALMAQGLNAWFGALHAVKNITVQIYRHQVTAVIGPSGCGKSTFIRCLNRMHEVIPSARVEGKAW